MTTLALNCLLNGKNAQDVFVVHVDASQPLFTLAESVLAKIHYPVVLLERLCKVSVLLDQLDSKLAKHDIGNMEEIVASGEMISTVFGGQETMHLNVLVEAPCGSRHPPIIDPIIKPRLDDLEYIYKRLYMWRWLLVQGSQQSEMTVLAKLFHRYILEQEYDIDEETQVIFTSGWPEPKTLPLDQRLSAIGFDVRSIKPIVLIIDYADETFNDPDFWTECIRKIYLHSPCRVILFHAQCVPIEVYSRVSVKSRHQIQMSGLGDNKPNPYERSLLHDKNGEILPAFRGLNIDKWPWPRMASDHDS